MANIKGTGAPTRKTLGAVGDIYTDNKTGRQYKCTFAYRSDDKIDFDCEWTPVKNKKIPVVEAAVKNDIPKEKVAEESTKIDESEVKEIEVEVEAEETEENTTTQKRTNYAAYGKKNK